MAKTRKQVVLDTVSDLVGNFLYYQRKEDEDLPVGAIEKMVAAGEITVDEIVAKFRSEIEQVIRAPV